MSYAPLFIRKCVFWVYFSLNFFAKVTSKSQRGTLRAKKGGGIVFCILGPLVQSVPSQHSSSSICKWNPQTPFGGNIWLMWGHRGLPQKDPLTDINWKSDFSLLKLVKISVIWGLQNFLQEQLFNQIPGDWIWEAWFGFYSEYWQYLHNNVSTFYTFNYYFLSDWQIDLIPGLMLTSEENKAWFGLVQQPNRIRKTPQGLKITTWKQGLFILLNWLYDFDPTN